MMLPRQDPLLGIETPPHLHHHREPQLLNHPPGALHGLLAAPQYLGDVPMGRAHSSPSTTVRGPGIHRGNIQEGLHSNVFL
jgi:hypothetical protein